MSVLAVIAFLMRSGGYRLPVRSLTVLVGILVSQAIVGIVQYRTGVPAELVWIHVLLTTLAWLAMLWSVGGAGRLNPRR